MQLAYGELVSGMECALVHAISLTEEGEVCVLVEGGEGGVGNAAFATAECRRTQDYTEGSAGEEREVELELKTIADVGMVS